MIIKQFFHPICEPVQGIFSSLQNVSGLFGLCDKQQYVLGFLPKWQYVALQNHQSLKLKRQGLDYESSIVHLPFDVCIKQAWQQSIAEPDHSRDCNEQFSGGLMGFIGYDYAAAQHINVKSTHPMLSPAALMGEYDIFLKQEHNGWQLYGPNLPEFEPIYAHIKALLTQPSATKPPNSLSVLKPFWPVWNKVQYGQAFDKIQQYLKQGDCYQVNLTQPFVAQVKGSLINTIEPLMALTKASYAGYVRYENFELLSCSPELFVAFKANGKIITKPIKGTRPRHTDSQQDELLKQQLIESIKDRAENLMIVDLLRNDLSVYAQTGSVQVPALFKVESFAQVHHLVSEIHATLRADASPLDVLFNALPGGSITGAPKIRAMQIIDELEVQPRGAYCGSMGYLNYNNTGQFNILIRSLQKHGETLTAWAGGGITVASECDAEYQECLDKIGAILACVNALGKPSTPD